MCTTPVKLAAVCQHACRLLHGMFNKWQVHCHTGRGGFRRPQGSAQASTSNMCKLNLVMRSRQSRRCHALMHGWAVVRKVVTCSMSLKDGDSGKGILPMMNPEKK